MQTTETILQTMVKDHPTLTAVCDDLRAACDMMLTSFRNGGKLLLCGNGGSACDCEHIAGELMKGFLLQRPLTADEKLALRNAGDDGALSQRLQRALPVLVLHGLSGMKEEVLRMDRVTYREQGVTELRHFCMVGTMYTQKLLLNPSVRCNSR